MTLRRGRRIPAVAVAVAIVLSGCSGSARPAPGGPRASPPAVAVSSVPGPPESSRATPPATSRAPRPSSVRRDPVTCARPGTTAFDCDLQRRIAAVQTYLRTRPGSVGIVLRDRRTGAVWHNRYADTAVWTASTIKLAMTVDLFTRNRAGLIALTADDRDLIQRMLHSSDDDAADTLWFRYAGADHLTYNDRFPRYGLTSLRPQAGFTHYYPYWGFQKCTPADLDRLIQYVLTTLDGHDRRYIVGQLQHVAPDQQWGVWGAGAAAHPGNKDGWSLEQGGWVMNSVGFAGPGQRYTLAVMNSLDGQGGYDDGRATDSQVARILFDGRF